MKTTEEAKEAKGYDAGKKTKGRKRHLLVDTLGLIMTALVHSAGIQDRDGGRYTLGKAKTKSIDLKKIWADGGYAGKLIEWAKYACDYVLEIVKRSEATKGFKILPKRWIVERTLSWLNRYRRLSKDYERFAKTSENMVYLAMTRLMLRRLAVAYARDG